MRWIVVLLVLAIMGCAGAKQKTEAPSTSAPVQAEAAKPVAPGPVATVTDAAKVSCSLDSDTRILEIVKKGAGCDLEYTKAGKMTSAATSAHGKKHCRDAQKKIRSKLEKSGFKCA